MCFISTNWRLTRAKSIEERLLDWFERIELKALQFAVVMQEWSDPHEVRFGKNDDENLMHDLRSTDSTAILHSKMHG